MKFILMTTASLAFLSTACAQDMTVPEDRMAACVADVTAKSAAAGAPAENPEAVCTCLAAKIAANEALEAEIKAANGLPAPDVASAEMVKVINSCKDAGKA